MSIGSRIQVQLVQILVGQDSDGRNREQEGERFGAWADVTNPSESRSYQNGQTVFTNTKSFLIRFRFNKYPDCNWKIRYQGKDWTISEIQKRDEKKFYWQLTATAKSDK